MIKIIIGIGGTVLKSNSNLDKTVEKYDSSNNMMNDTLVKLGNALSSKSTVVCYAIIFIFAILFFLYKVSY